MIAVRITLIVHSGITSYRYSVDMCSYSGPSGILGSDGIRIPLKPVLGDIRIFALSISSH